MLGKSVSPGRYTLILTESTDYVQTAEWGPQTPSASPTGFDNNLFAFCFRSLGKHYGGAPTPARRQLTLQLNFEGS